jgi:large subunit ribosomal protein L4
MKVKVYNQEGKEVGQAELPAEIFDVAINEDLIHQAVVTQMANVRKVIAHTKDRSEVRGGGRKPWRQKGTGRARHGSIRSPIWRGGGVTFGPTKERVFAKKINKKMKRKALLMVLSSKVKDKEMVLLDKLELAEAKTKQMAEIINSLKTKIKKDLDKGTLIVLSKTDQKITRAVRNIPKIKTIRADSLNVLDVLSHRYLLMPQGAIEVIKETYLK